MKIACLKTYAIQEHKGLVWIWRGNILEANGTKLPQTRKGSSTYPCDTILDYNVDWQYIVENNLDSPHLFWLHNGLVPPVRLLNFVRDKVNQMQSKFFSDDSGHGHYDQTAGGKPKVVRFDAPNIVCCGGVSSSSKEVRVFVPNGKHCLTKEEISAFHHLVPYCSNSSGKDACVAETKPS